MLVIATGKTPGEGEDYLGGGVVPGSIIAISDLGPASIKAAMKGIKKIGHSRILDLMVDSDTLGTIQNLDGLNRLIKDPNFALDGVRIWKE